MRFALSYKISYLALVILSSCSNQNAPLTREISFNAGWKFHRAEVIDGQSPALDDSNWRIIDLPHDYSIEDLPPRQGAKQIGPFSPVSVGGPSTGHVEGGVAWYRKHFTIDEKHRHAQVSVLFDGVYMNADVWINGNHLGNHPYGYTAFTFNLTKFLNPPGQENILAVEVKNKGKNSRWYSGSGIYRNVTLIINHLSHIDRWRTFITTPSIYSEMAQVDIATTIVNTSTDSGPIEILAQIFNSSGELVTSLQGKVSLNSAEKTIEKLSLQVPDPQLWSDQLPTLYTATISLFRKGKILDQISEHFGIRSIEFSATKGFLLNGNGVLLKGACIHHDNGILGAAAFKSAEYRKIEILKEYGFNAIRTAHNPPSKELLDACDQLGMLVIDESFDQWQRPKNENDYSVFFDEWWEKDLESMILRDRNHPSIIIWSFGNEINERADSSGLEIAKKLIEKIHSLDPTRPATQAICKFWEHPEKTWKDSEPVFAPLDVHSYNYQWQQYEEDHQNFTERVMLGTESFALEAYDSWKMVETHPYVIGDFVWTGMDYFGESGIAHTIYKDHEEEEWLGLADWPWFNAWCGDIDILGFKKAQSYFRDVIWKESDLEIAVHEPIPDGMVEYLSPWSWPKEYQSWNWEGFEGVPLQVSVYSRCDEVILKLNNQVVETIANSEFEGLISRIHIPYQPGMLTAIGIKAGKEVARKVLQTTEKPFQLKITPEKEQIKTSIDDLAYFNVEVMDNQGRLVPDAEVTVSFNIQGKCQLLAVGNSNPQDMKSFQSPQVKTFMGRCQLIVRSCEDEKAITVTAEAQGLKSATTRVQLN